MIANKTKVKSLITLFLIFAVLVGALKPKAEAASAADFYKDKKIIFIAATKAGGGTDLYSRVIAPYLKTYTGAYAVVVDNVAEAGGIVAFNRLWNSKPDGLTLAMRGYDEVILMEATQQGGVQFQADKFNIIFAATSQSGFVLVVNSNSPFHSVDDLKKAKGLKSAGPYSMAITEAFFVDVLGLDAKITPGMSMGDARLALQRGEIDFFGEPVSAAFEGVETGAMRPLCTDLSTPISLAGLQVPSVTKFASLSPQQKEWMRFFESLSDSKYVFAGPNVPEDRIDYLRAVFEKIHKDPQFLNDRKKIERRLPGGQPWLNGTEAQKVYMNCFHSANKGYRPMAEYLSKKYFTVK